MTAADQIAEMRRRASARDASINRGRFARRIRPTKRGWRYATLLPRNGRQDMWDALSKTQRTPVKRRAFWMTARNKIMISRYMLEHGKIRAWLEQPAFVSGRNNRLYGW